jgi:hypothetical protein
MEGAEMAVLTAMEQAVAAGTTAVADVNLTTYAVPSVSAPVPATLYASSVPAEAAPVKVAEPQLVPTLADAAVVPARMPGSVSVTIVPCASSDVALKPYVNVAIAFAAVVVANVSLLAVSDGAVMAGEVGITAAGVGQVEVEVSAAVLAGELAARGPGGADTLVARTSVHAVAAVRVAVATVNVRVASACPEAAVVGAAKVEVPHPVFVGAALVPALKNGSFTVIVSVCAMAVDAVKV